MGNTQYIFVGGCGRSGTTLLQKILVGHSQIAGSAEFRFNENIMKLFAEMKQEDAMEHIGSFYYSEKQLEDRIREFIDGFFVGMKGDGIQFISEKTPSNVLVVEELLSIFPEAKFINMVRDGRDVLASHMEVRKRYLGKGKIPWGLKVAQVCDLWNQSVNCYLKVKDNPRVYNVRYEDLVSDPEKVVSGIMDFLGLALEAKMLEVEKSDAQGSNVAINDLWYTKEQYAQKLSGSKIGSWKNRLSARQKWQGQTRMVHTLNQLGYPVKNSFTFWATLTSLLSYSDWRERLKKMESLRQLVHRFRKLKYSS